jgi:hypothetical protein
MSKDTKPEAPDAKPLAAGTKSPRQWFQELAPTEEDKPSRLQRLTSHQAAAAVHGWQIHSHHAGAPIQLTRADYEQAIVGATSGLGRAGIHRPALSPHKMKAS